MNFVLQISWVVWVKGAVSVLVSIREILQDKQLEKNIYKWKNHKIPSWDNPVAVSAITPEVDLFRGEQQCANPTPKNMGYYCSWWNDGHGKETKTSLTLLLIKMAY